MGSDAISIFMLFDALRGVGRQTERRTGARAGGRMGSNVTGQQMTLIELNILCDSVTTFSEYEPICYTSG